MRQPRPEDALSERGPDRRATPRRDEELAAHSRTLRNSVISLASSSGSSSRCCSRCRVCTRSSNASPTRTPGGWPPRSAWSCSPAPATSCCSGWCSGCSADDLVSRLSLSELAVNSVVSVSGLAGLALGAWVLRTKGISVERIAKRSVLLFVLTSAVNVGAVVVIGVPMWLGLIPGSTNPLLTLLPAAAALATILGTLALAAWARRAAARRPLEQGRWAVTLVALSGGVEDAVRLIREHDWRVLGAVGYWLFDNLALYACLAAFGATPGVWVVAMAYLVGMLANSLPIPGGFVAVEGGLVGMLVLFGVRPAAVVVAAVLVYRAVSLWVPAVIGSLAFLSLRREIGKPLKPTPVGAAGS